MFQYVCRCILEQQFKCRGFDYEVLKQTCWLTELTPERAYGINVRDGWDYYERDPGKVFLWQISFICLYVCQWCFQFLQHLSFHDMRFCQIIWQIFTQGRAKKIVNPQPLDHHSNTLLSVLAWYVLGRRFLKWALFHAPLQILDFGNF